MIEVRRLMAVAAILAAGAVLSCADVWGEPGLDKGQKDWRQGGNNVKPDAGAGHFDTKLERSRFADQPVVLYQSQGGERLFALQLLPKLDNAPARPTDYLVFIPTSASKPHGALALACH